MSSDASANTVTVVTEGAGKEKKCHKDNRHDHGDRHFPFPREDVVKIWKECQEESFWQRALPFSVGGMAVTGALIYAKVWKASPRFGPFPKLAVAGILGYAVGKASYIRTCRSKFQTLGPAVGPEGGPWQGPWSGPGGGRRHCHHVCEECKKQQLPAAAAATDSAQS